MGRYLLFVLTIILLLAVPVSCNSQGAELKPDIDRAIATTSEVESYRSEGSSEVIIDGTETMSASFKTEVAAIDRFYSKTTGDDLWLEVVKDGDQCYFREGEDEPWKSCEEEVGEGNQTLEMVEMPIAGAISLLAYMSNIEELSQEDVDGVTCTRYQGNIDPEAYLRDIAEAMGETPPAPADLAGWSIDLQVWIDGEDYVRRMDIETRIPATAEQGQTLMKSTTSFYDFGEDIEITLPEV